jgi:hypothetical protein
MATDAYTEAIPCEGSGNIVRYRVSEFLADRHPYKPNQGFMVHAEKYKGRVFKGFDDAAGLKGLILCLKDPSLDVSQKINALKILHSKSAAQEMKVVLIRQSLIPIISELVLRGNANTAPVELELYVAKLLYSFAVLPQGSHAVVVQGGLNCLLRIAAPTGGAAREESRVEALRAISQISLTWEGRAWLLKKEAPQDLQLLPVKFSSPEEVENASAENDEDSAVNSHSSSNTAAAAWMDFEVKNLFQTLVAVLKDPTTKSSLLSTKLALDSLANLTMDADGLEQMLSAQGLAAISDVLGFYGKTSSWISLAVSDKADQIMVPAYAATAVWHAGLQDSGRVAAEKVADLVSNLAQVLHHVTENSIGTSQLHLKGALTGALCALMLHPPLKATSLAAIATLPQAPCPLDVLLHQLRQANEAFTPLFKMVKRGDDLPAGSPHPETIKPVMKNCVQAIRLVTELPRASEYLVSTLCSKENLSDDKERDMLRQLYHSTPFEQKFGVEPL